MHHMLRLAALLLALLSLSACAPPEPIKLGYVGTLSGSSADSGLSGRNGALLAVEEINADGGINGRPIRLLVRDDGLDDTISVRAIEQLAAERVAAIIGPNLSKPAFTMAPVADRLGVVLVSPTATADELTGRDDMLFRLSSPTSAHARMDADFQFRKAGRRRIAVAYDLSNHTYTNGYLREFRAAFTAMGGAISITIPYDATKDPDFGSIVRELNRSRPDALLFVANAVDSARLAQHARHQSPSIPLVGVAWAGTEQLLSLGGRAVEGMHVGQYFNRDDASPTYQAFKNSYQERFFEPPGFISTAAYDAVRTVAEALARKPREQPLKAALLTLGPFPGTQNPIVFDPYGDAKRPSYITVIRNNQLVIAP